jgi:hypothetical protein
MVSGLVGFIHVRLCNYRIAVLQKQTDGTCVGIIHVMYRPIFTACPFIQWGFAAVGLFRRQSNLVPIEPSIAVRLA